MSFGKYSVYLSSITNVFLIGLSFGQNWEYITPLPSLTHHNLIFATQSTIVWILGLISILGFHSIVLMFRNNRNQSKNIHRRIGDEYHIFESDSPKQKIETMDNSDETMFHFGLLLYFVFFGLLAFIFNETKLQILIFIFQFSGVFTVICNTLHRFANVVRSEETLFLDSAPIKPKDTTADMPSATNTTVQ